MPTSSIAISIGNSDEIQVDGNLGFELIPAMVTAGGAPLVNGTSSIVHNDYLIGEAITV
jgi:hypothetical protein